MKNSGGN
jgi:hypothetical protein